MYTVLANYKCLVMSLIVHTVVSWLMQPIQCLAMSLIVHTVVSWLMQPDQCLIMSLIVHTVWVDWCSQISVWSWAWSCTQCKVIDAVSLCTCKWVAVKFAARASILGDLVIKFIWCRQWLHATHLGCALFMKWVRCRQWLHAKHLGCVLLA